MSILDSLLATIAPLDCIVCNQENCLLCTACTPLLGAYVPSRCFSCYTPTQAHATCVACSKAAPIASVVPTYVYTALAKQLVAEFKFGGKRGGAKDMARLMQLPRYRKTTILVHIPTATTRVRSRGYDHAKLLTNALSYNVGLVHVSALARTTQGRQVGLGRAQRTVNMKEAFRVVLPDMVKGAHVVLVDDVVTTGATLASAARALLQAGALRVDAAVFAQAPK